MDLQLKGKTAVVTGAGSGIGRAIANRLGREGVVVFVLDLDDEKGAETVASIENAGGSARYLSCNVADAASVERVFSQVERLDILVNNAGISSVGNVEATTPEEMDRVYAVNVKGVYHCLREGIINMKAHGGGVVLNLASIASKLGIADRFAYSMSKGAVLAMTLSVARDYVSAGIRCNCICPARVHTPFVDSFLDRHYADNRGEMLEKLSAYQPIGRMGRPEEIADLAAFLCGDVSAFITGAAYDIDGGVTLLR